MWCFYSKKKSISADRNCSHIKAKDNEKAERMAPMSHLVFILSSSYIHHFPTIPLSLYEFIHVSIVVKSVLD